MATFLSVTDVTVSLLYTQNTLYSLDNVLTTLDYDDSLWPYLPH